MLRTRGVMSSPVLTDESSACVRDGVTHDLGSIVSDDERALRAAQPRTCPACAREHP
jgi:hypothetical protein